MRTSHLLFAALLALAAAPVGAQDEAKETADPKQPKAAEPKAEITVAGTKGEEGAKAKLRADAAISRCRIKPVMTDEEIQVCVQAYRQSDRQIAQAKTKDKK